MPIFSGNGFHSDSTDNLHYESGGRGVIVVTLAAAFATTSLILYGLYRFISKILESR